MTDTEEFYRYVHGDDSSSCLEAYVIIGKEVVTNKIYSV